MNVEILHNLQLHVAGWSFLFPFSFIDPWWGWDGDHDIFNEIILVLKCLCFMFLGTPILFVPIHVCGCRTPTEVTERILKGRMD